MIGAPSSVVFLVDSGITRFVTIPGMLLIARWLEVDIYTINYILYCRHDVLLSIRVSLLVHMASCISFVQLKLKADSYLRIPIILSCSTYLFSGITGHSHIDISYHIQFSIG